MNLIMNPSVWWHAKDYVTLNFFLFRYGDRVKVFSHEQDRYGLVTSGYIWTSDTNIDIPHENSTIWILPTLTDDLLIKILKEVPWLAGVCSDDVKKIRDWETHLQGEPS